MEEILEDEEPFDGLDPFEWWHHHHRKLRSADMSVTLNPGQSVTFTPAPKFGDGSADPNATSSFSESSGGAVVSQVNNADGTATFTFVADGESSVTLTCVDGSVTVSTGVNNPDTITCVTPPPPQELTSADIEEGAVA